MEQARPDGLASPTLDEKRRAALAYLGQRHVLHDKYQLDPRHSNNPATYLPARQPYLLAVKMAAALTRKGAVACK